MEVLIAKRYKLQKKIGVGGFGDVYEAYDTKTNHKLALKLEKRTAAVPMLLYEAKILKYLRNVPGVPKIASYGFTGDFNYMGLELLGSNLERQLQLHNNKFSLKTCLQLAHQMIDLIEAVHNQGIVHRDIKPDNFLLGDPQTSNFDKLYILDFGLSKRYIDDQGVHISRAGKKKFRGTLRYCTVNMHQGIENTRRDDMESICYVLIYMLKGSLPWQSLKGDAQVKMREIEKVKLAFNPVKLCQGLPAEVLQICQACFNLGFDEKPDYGYLKALVVTCLKSHNWKLDFGYDWSKEPWHTQSQPTAKGDQQRQKQMAAKETRPTNSQQAVGLASEVEEQSKVIQSNPRAVEQTPQHYEGVNIPDAFQQKTDQLKQNFYKQYGRVDDLEIKALDTGARQNPTFAKTRPF